MAKHISDKGLVWGIETELPQVNTKKTKKSVFK